MSRMSAVFIVGAMFLAPLIACSNSSVHKQKISSAPFVIGIGHGGGFTGAESGYHLDRWGNLLAYSRLPGADERILGQSVVSQDSAAYWYQTLSALALAPANYRQRGDVYQKIFLREGDSTKVWLWGPADEKNVPERLRTFYQRFSRFCQRHLEGKQK